jgi:hypothetical protein
MQPGMRTHHIVPFLLLVHCAGGAPQQPGGGAGAIQFHAATPALPDLKHDTGWLPAGSPIQVRLQLGAEGTLSVDAAADSAMQPIAGSGKLKSEAMLKAQALMKIDLPGVKYEGPLKNAPSIDIKLGGETIFDPFLVGGGEATVDLNLPAGDLATIPLAGAVPVPGVSGNLIVKLVKSDVKAVWKGSCAARGHYAGTLGVKGSLTIEPRVELKAGALLNKTLAPFAIDVPIPEVALPLQLATSPAQAAEGDSCDAPGGGSSPGSSADGGSSGGGGDGGGASPDAALSHVPGTPGCGELEACEVDCYKNKNGQPYCLDLCKRDVDGQSRALHDTFKTCSADAMANYCKTECQQNPFDVFCIQCVALCRKTSGLWLCYEGPCKSEAVACFNDT